MAHKRERELLANVNVRLHLDQANWLRLRAAESGTTVSEEVRSLVWLAMERAGDVKLEHEDAAANDMEHVFRGGLARDAE